MLMTAQFKGMVNNIALVKFPVSQNRDILREEKKFKLSENILRFFCMHFWHLENKGFFVLMVGGGWELFNKKFRVFIFVQLWAFTQIFNVLKFGNYVHIVIKHFLLWFVNPLKLWIFLSNFISEIMHLYIFKVVLLLKNGTLMSKRHTHS